MLYKNQILPAAKTFGKVMGNYTLTPQLTTGSPASAVFWARPASRRSAPSPTCPTACGGWRRRWRRGLGYSWQPHMTEGFIKGIKAFLLTLQHLLLDTAEHVLQRVVLYVNGAGDGLV